MAVTTAPETQVPAIGVVPFIIGFVVITGAVEETPAVAAPPPPPAVTFTPS